MGAGSSCPPGARGLLALLLLLLPPLPGARGDCGTPPTRENAIPLDTRTGGFPVESIVQYKCINDLVKIPGKSDTAICLPNSEWRVNGVFCGRSCGVPPRFRSAALRKEDEMKSYYPPGTTVTYVCRPGYEPTELMPIATCLENVKWSESPELCKRIITNEERELVGLLVSHSHRPGVAALPNMLFTEAVYNSHQKFDSWSRRHLSWLNSSALL